MKHPKRTLIFVFLNLAAIFGLTACGHNAVVFGKGFGLRAGFDPEHMSADVSFIYGEQLTLAARDNIEIELASDVEGGQENATADVKTGSKLKIRIGQQINGYFVEAVEAGADAKDLVKINEAETAKYLEAEYEKALKIARERGPQTAAEDEVKAAEEPAAMPEPVE